MYDEFTQTIEQAIELKKNPVIKEYLDLIEKLKLQSSTIKSHIEAWELVPEKNDYFTFSKWKRSTFNVDAVKELLWEDAGVYIKETVDATALKKDFKSWKHESLLDINLDDICEFKDYVICKCPIIK